MLFLPTIIDLSLIASPSKSAVSVGDSTPPDPMFTGGLVAADEDPTR